MSSRGPFFHCATSFILQQSRNEIEEEKTPEQAAEMTEMMRFGFASLSHSAPIQRQPKQLVDSAHVGTRRSQLAAGKRVFRGLSKPNKEQNVPPPHTCTPIYAIHHNAPV